LFDVWDSISLGPPDILHSAEVAIRKYDAGAKVLSSHLDKDDVLGIWKCKRRPGQVVASRSITSPAPLLLTGGL
jgi:hypothetical protein